VLLPLLRAFTVVKGVRFPPEVVAYLGIEATQMTDYRRHAC
jgi:glutaredoxin 2